MHRIVFIAHDPHTGGIVNADAPGHEVDIEAAQIATNAVKARLERLADQDYVAFFWSDEIGGTGRIWAVRRVLDAEPAGYGITQDYVRLVTTKNGISPAIRDSLLAYRGPWFGRRNPVRYGHIARNLEVTFPSDTGTR